MAEGKHWTAAGAESLSMIPDQIAALVPTFDPSKEDLQLYSQKVGLPEQEYTTGDTPDTEL